MRIIIEKFLMVLVLAAGRIGYWLIEVSHTVVRWLRALGWDEIVANPANIIVLEWPERVAEIIPKDAIMLRFDIVGDGRIITLHKKHGKKDNNN